jgi:murein DD-endopeptidase MepM/ murein hydrolase activator NlpD
MRPPLATVPVASIVGCVLVVLATPGCGADEPAPAPAPIREPVAAEQPSTLESRPSALARRVLDPSLLRRYRRTADEIGIDWAVLAAADQAEGARGPAPRRVPALAYTLQAFAAADDYQPALEQRGGRTYAARVQRLAQRYRQVVSPPETASLPLALPAKGTIIAGYGQRFGILHDGIDIDAPSGDPVRAATAGVITSMGDHPIFGLHTCAIHRLARPFSGIREFTTCYGNQSATSVEPGDRVDGGDQIGQVGCTGTCLRPHVHFQVRDGDDQTSPTVDPAPFLTPSARRDAAGAGRPLETAP